MADLREVFPILSDSATGAGEAAISRVEGEAAAGQEGLIGFSFKDASGNVVLPSLTSEGKILVDTEGFGGVCKSDYGSNAGSLSVTTIATLDETVISVSKVYEKFEVLVSCMRDTLWEIVYIDDTNGTPVLTVIAAFLTGPGQFTVIGKIDCLELDTTGGTDDQNIILRATNLDKASTTRGLLACKERAST